MPEDAEDCANPLLLGWVKEWLDTARERNSKGMTTYRNAYNALKACPIPFEHPSECQTLKGFGPKLCDRLTQNLKKHCEQNGLPMPNPKRKASNDDVGLDEQDTASSKPAKKPRKTKPYVPALRSGAYALIVALSTLDEDTLTGMTKVQLIEVAQPFCDSSFSAPSDPTKFYTAWNSMKTIIDKGFVYVRGGPSKRYSLTDEGWDVARRIQKTTQPGQLSLAPQRHREPGLDNHNDAASNLESPFEGEPHAPPTSRFADVVSGGDTSTESSAIPSFRPIRLAPRSFTIELVVDVREVRAKTDRDYIQQELAKRGVTPTMRSLELGDALWVAKCHDPAFLTRHGAEGDEVMLDYIVERKRLDDLIGSVKDGRFHEQKFRLKRSGVKNVVYIVEEIAMDSMSVQKYEEMVQSAIASTQVVNGYFLKKTQKMDDTIHYLTRMTKLLKNRYEDKALHIIPTEVLTAQNYLPLLDHLRQKEPASNHYITYPAFASLASKSEMMTLRDVYLKMLMCTRQITGEKALEIQKRWHTPYNFVKAFENCGSGEAGLKKKREMVFGQMGNLVGRRRITRPLSQRVAEVWGDV